MERQIGVFAVAAGDPFDGVTLYGTFDTHDHAVEWASEEIEDTWWIVEIKDTEEVR
jgi:hypothetical protein